MTGERDRLWDEWVSRLNETTTPFVSELGQRKSFRDVFLQSEVRRGIEQMACLLGCAVTHGFDYEQCVFSRLWNGQFRAFSFTGPPRQSQNLLPC